METGCGGIQLHAAHDYLFSKIAGTLGTPCYGPARSSEGVCCVTAPKGEKAGPQQDK